MMARTAAAVFVALAGPGALGASVRDTARYGANPIRKVVNLLENLQAKVVEEGKEEKQLFDKFMCYCKTGVSELDASMKAAKEKIESLEAALDGAGEKKAQTEQDLKDHQNARSDAKQAIAQATALRETQAAEYAKLAAENKANIDAMGKAIAALNKGSSGAFLQTAGARAVQRFAMEKADLPDGARDAVLAFLSGSQSEGYAPQAGQITGILKGMLDTLVKNDADATAAEQAAIASFNELVTAKKKEIEALTAQIEDEQLRIGELGVLLATGANDLKSTKKSLDADTQFQIELQSNCATKAGEWDEIVKTRNEELAALAEVIKVLNDDDALDAFSKALPAASFVQLQVTTAEVKDRALAAIRSVPKSGSPQLDLIELALSAKKVGFDKVLKLIDDLVSNLHKEQDVDDDKKLYCNSKLDEAEDKQKALERSISDSEAAIDAIEGSIAQLKEEIAALTAGIKELDRSVKEATAQREAEHKDFQENAAANKAAKDLLLWAKNRLNKFYNPKMYKPEAAAAAFFQLSAFSARRIRNGEAPAPPPEAPGAYHKKSEESSGVILLIDGLVQEIDRDDQQSAVEEKNSQKAYEKMTADASAKRAADAASITEKESAVAAQEEALQAENDKKRGSETELSATVEVINSLHNECDWLIQHFEVRKEARTAEIQGLEKAKAVLHGADFSLLQTRAGRVPRKAGFLASSA